MMERWLILLLLLVDACWSATCPQDCSCYREQGLYKAECSFLPSIGDKVQVLQVLPDDTSSSTLQLKDGQFSVARQLQYLNLSHNSVFFIQKKAFYGAGSLIEIDLSYNFIEELEPSVFQHLKKLINLSLRGNPLQILPEKPFLVSNSIQYLDIGYCKLTSIPRGIFYGLGQLRHLSLDGNALKTLKYNYLPKALTYLNLAQNNIVNVPTEVFTSLTNLRRIALSGNPVNCTCALLNFQDWFSGKGRIFEDNVTCALPIEYSGINWSKIDENKLCLAEERRDELPQPTIYNKLFKNKFKKGYYFENEKNTLDENWQSDQPHPDSQVEVNFSNKETRAMGEMMRDEEFNNSSETNQNDAINNEAVNTPSGTELSENEEVIENDADKSVANEGNNTTPENIHKDTEQSLSSGETETKESNNDIIESDNLAHEGEGSINNTHESLSDSSNINTALDIETNLPSNNTNNSSESTPEPTIESIQVLDGEDTENLNVNKTVEFKHFEEPASESDDFKKEGFFPSIGQLSVANVSSVEESTITPDYEETTPDIEEPPSTDEPAVLDSETNKDQSDINSTVQTSTVDSDFPVVENNTSTTEATIVHTPSVNLSTELYEHVSNDTILKITNSDRSLEVKSSADNLAGAEVVMFCISILVICLVFYAIYKCRTPKSHQNQTMKGLESNRCTELQDMASLLPKPQDNDDKKNSKYTDKATIASETMKLIPEQTETESQEFTSVPDSKEKANENNSINNNTTNPMNKTQSLKPKNVLNVNQPEPIQRAKARVGVLPDSIPKTPIFLQKTYNNGTKKV